MHKLNIDREELIEKLDDISSALLDVRDDVQDSLYNEEPRNRYGVSAELRKHVGALAALADKFGRTKKGLMAVPSVPKPKAASGEKVFKLSSAIRSRTYTFSNGTVVVPNPRHLVVKSDGSRELTTSSGQRYHVNAGYTSYSDSR